MTFYVGQKVVCVDARDTTLRDDRELTEGAIYTVSWVGEYAYRPYIGQPFAYPARPCVHLAEINREQDADGEVVPFLACRFRPVTERKTDISIFRKLLNPATHRHLEGV